MRSTNRGMALVAVFVCFLLPGCSSNKDVLGNTLVESKAREQRLQNEVTENHQLLIPEWYREKYFASDDWAAHLYILYFNRLHLNILLLGLLLYPVMWIPNVIIYGLADDISNDEEKWGFLFGMLLFPYGSSLVLSLLFAFLSWLCCGFFSNEGYFVPFEFTSFCLHILFMTFLALMLASAAVPAAWKIKIPGLSFERNSSAVKITFSYLRLLKFMAVGLLVALGNAFLGHFAALILGGVAAGFAIMTSD